MGLAVPAYKRSRFAVVGGNFAVRRAALQKIGGFDTSIPFYGDDTNIARRLHEVGTVTFTTDFYNFSSARRLKGQGFLRTGFIYALNYLSQAFWKKTVTQAYGEREWEDTPQA